MFQTESETDKIDTFDNHRVRKREYSPNTTYKKFNNMPVYPSDPSERQVSTTNRMDEATIRRNQTCNNCRTILIFAILIAIITGMLLIVSAIRQNLSSETILIQAEEKANKQEKAIFNDCIDILWENLLRLYFNQSNPDHLQPIRIKVFNTLRHLNSAYKRDLILFLYERELIRTDIPIEQRLHLYGADLNNIHFENINLNYLYLPGVNALNSHFSNCTLKKSNFQGSIMDGSHFIACSLQGSMFSGASLKQSSFTNDNALSTVDFTNTDLFGSDINTDLFVNNNITLNIRLPNGSFYNIDSKQLINNGGAEQKCNTSGSDHWGTEHGYSPLSIVRRGNKTCIPMGASENNKCYFQATSTGRLIQNVDLNRYSTLIDNNRAWFNVSADLGCSNNSQNDWSVVELRFLDHRKNHENNQVHSLKYGTSWKLLSDSSLIPTGTRSVRIMIGTMIQNLSTVSSSCCVIDDVNMNIFEKNE